MSQCGFPQFLFMRLLWVYFFLSDITIFYAYGHGVPVLKRWTEFIGLFPIPVLLLIYVLLFAGATVLFYLMPKKFRTFTECFDPVLLLVSVIVFSCALVFRSDDFHLAVFVGLFALIFVVYASSRIHPETLNNQRSETFVIVPVAAMTVIVLGFVITTSVVIYKSFRTATFDMGIFNQMFHSMRKNLSAVTTCERGYALSHFRVHGSFILYLLLPVYAIFPSGETLIISQAVLVLSGVIPLYLIAKKRGFKGTALFFCCMIYVFSLGILSPCYFHFHENAFLPPLLDLLGIEAEGTFLGVSMFDIPEDRKIILGMGGPHAVQGDTRCWTTERECIDVAPSFDADLYGTFRAAPAEAERSKALRKWAREAEEGSAILGRRNQIFPASTLANPPPAK